ncbi:hypothetical protein CYMTET_15722 [Cymbomonas tetramitiformis]|uniref:SB domain-containing protein n=1 Tax=Cymbomonas tetramitiformis TaxID=36881 RepID=A0AAE0GDT2_9CHLO|nr:hypothetical protein CYMTET_15722 [Cymbomonas tetramitiformis]
MVAPTVQQAWPQSSQAEDSSSQSLHQASNGGEARVPTDVFRQRAIEAIKRRLQAVLSDNRKREDDQLLETQMVLLGRSGELEASLQQVNQERELLERRVAELSAANSSLDRWLLENEGKCVAQTCESEMTDIFEADDVLARQALECAAKDAAIEDTLYGLDRALQRNKISIEAYFKQVRLLAREQFFKRALGNLVSDRRTAQLREQEARASSERAAARAASSQFPAVSYGAAPPTGDASAIEYTWT